MKDAALLDQEAIARACQRFESRGCASSGQPSPITSTLSEATFDFFVDFQPQVADLLGNYLGLNAELERITGRKVDLVMTDAVGESLLRGRGVA